MTEYAIPTNSYPEGIVASGDGNICFTESNANVIGSMTTSGTLGAQFQLSGAAYPQAITVGPDGNIWFTEIDTAKIGTVR